MRLGQFLGFSERVPVISGNGIPAFVEPKVMDKQSRVVVHNPIFWAKGERANPDIVPNNLAITGADVRSIAEDIVMRGPQRSGQDDLLAGNNEDTRQCVVRPKGQQKAPTGWVSAISSA